MIITIQFFLIISTKTLFHYFTLRLLLNYTIWLLQLQYYYYSKEGFNFNVTFGIVYFSLSLQPNL